MPRANIAAVVYRGLVWLFAAAAVGPELALACSCAPPPDLCSNLSPDMVAFVGRPLSSTASDARKRFGRSTSFRIEERLWGLPTDLDLISVQDHYFYTAKDFDRSWFVLAGRRRPPQEHPGGGGGFTYFVDFSCCPYGLVEPSDHPWANEFRSFVAQRKRTALRVEVHSQNVHIAGARLRLTGRGEGASSSSFWEGISSDWAAMKVSVPPGEYTVGIEKPHFTFPEANRQLSLLPGTCATVRLELVPTSFVSGRITDARGAPPPPLPPQQGLHYSLEGEVRMEESLWDTALAAARGSFLRLVNSRPGGSQWLSPPKKDVYYAVTPDRDGHFHLQVLPGRYRLSVTSQDSHEYVFPPPIPKTYYPGVMERARAVEIVVPVPAGGGSGGGGSFRDIEFRLPDYRGTRRVEIELVREGDGSPPVPGEVVAYTGRHPSTAKGREFRITGWTQKLTDSRGRATFEVWEFLDYDLHIRGIDAVTDGEGERRLRREIPAGTGPVSRRFVVRR